MMKANRTHAAEAFTMTRYPSSGLDPGLDMPDTRRGIVDSSTVLYLTEEAKLNPGTLNP